MVATALLKLSHRICPTGEAIVDLDFARNADSARVTFLPSG